jgi:hypothetical protein
VQLSPPTFAQASWNPLLDAGGCNLIGFPIVAWQLGDLNSALYAGEVTSMVDTERSVAANEKIASGATAAVNPEEPEVPANVPPPTLQRLVPWGFSADLLTPHPP